MDNSYNKSWSLAVSTRLYRALLAVYPSEFRQAYGSPMLQAFRDCSQRALRERGAAGLLTLWIRTMLDTAQTALEEHTQRGIEMSKEKFYKLSGWALMLGGIALMLGWLAGTRPEYNRFNARSMAIDQYANAAEGPLMFMSMFLLSVGIIGFTLRYGQGASLFGRFSLGMGALSGVVSFVGAIGLGIYDHEIWWAIFFIGLILEFLGLALFGLTNLRERILPRWNGLPILTGIWLPIYVLVSASLEQVSGNWVQLPPAVDLGLWLLTTAGLFILGYLLQWDSRAASAPAAAAV